MALFSLGPSRGPDVLRSKCDSGPTYILDQLCGPAMRTNYDSGPSVWSVIIVSPEQTWFKSRVCPLLSLSEKKDRLWFSTNFIKGPSEALPAEVAFSCEISSQEQIPIPGILNHISLRRHNFWAHRRRWFQVFLPKNIEHLSSKGIAGQIFAK